MRTHTYQQHEDIHTGEEVLVDFMADGAVNPGLFRHGEHHDTPLLTHYFTLKMLTLCFHVA